MSRESHAFRVRFSHGRVLFDSLNVEKSVTQIIYLGPLPIGQPSLAHTARPSAVILAMLHLQVDNVAKRLSFSAKSIWSLCKTGVMHTFDATEIFAFFAFFRAHYLHFQCDRDFCILQSSISKCQHIFSNELQSLSCHFDNAVHESLLQTAVLCSISTRSLMEIGQCSSCG